MNQPENTSKFKIDWVNLPSDIIPISLWDCLHDAKLLKISSDLYDRSVTIEFGAYHIFEYHEMSEDMRFVFEFEKVTSARVCKYSIWPGKFERPDNISRDEERRLVDEYQSKWREESLGWDDFLKIIQDKENNFDISHSEFATKGNEMAFRIEGMLNGSLYHEIFLKASNLIIKKSDGEIISIDQFLRLGQEFWNDFEERANK
jgi:hypothetical protein